MEDKLEQVGLIRKTNSDERLKWIVYVLKDVAFIAFKATSASNQSKLWSFFGPDPN